MAPWPSSLLVLGTTLQQARGGLSARACWPQPSCKGGHSLHYHEETGCDYSSPCQGWGSDLLCTQSPSASFSRADLAQVCHRVPEASSTQQLPAGTARPPGQRWCGGCGWAPGRSGSVSLQGPGPDRRLRKASDQPSGHSQVTESSGSTPESCPELSDEEEDGGFVPGEPSSTGPPEGWEGPERQPASPLRGPPAGLPDPRGP